MTTDDTQAPTRTKRQAAATKPRFFTIKQVAELLSVSDRSVDRWIADKKLVVHRFEGARRVSDRDLQTFIDRHRDS